MSQLNLKFMDDGYHRRDKPRKQEKRVAEEVGGTRQPASGALSRFKGDVKNDRFLFEAKRTEYASISVNVGWLAKICREAEKAGKLPALTLEWGEMPFGVPRDWVMVPMAVFREAVGK